MSRGHDDAIIQRLAADRSTNTDEALGALARRLLALELEAGDPKRWEIGVAVQADDRERWARMDAQQQLSKPWWRRLFRGAF